MSVMIVENDWLLTGQLETWLREDGVEVAGVAASVAAARRLAARSRPTHAIVDYNLGGEMARSLIAELCDAGVKVVVVSGYANICERLTILHPGRSVGAREIHELLPGASPAGGGAGQWDGAVPGEGSLTERLEAYERRIVEAALDEAGGNVAEAARRLETDRPNLYRRMKRLGITR